MDRKDWIDRVFQSIDAMDAEAFSDFITEDGSFRYGSGPAVEGRAAIREYVAGFFSTLKSIRHRLIGTWEVEDGAIVIVQGEVTYTLPNDAEVPVPFLNLFRMDGDHVRDYLVYADPTPMAEAASGG